MDLENKQEVLKNYKNADFPEVFCIINTDT